MHHAFLFSTDYLYFLPARNFCPIWWGESTSFQQCWIFSKNGAPWRILKDLGVVWWLGEASQIGQIFIHVYMYSAFHKLRVGYISSGSKGSIIEPLDLNWSAPPRVQKWYVVEGPSSTLLENSISASCFLPIKKERPQECRSGIMGRGRSQSKTTNTASRVANV